MKTFAMSGRGARAQARLPHSRTLHALLPAIVFAVLAPMAQAQVTIDPRSLTQTRTLQQPTVTTVTLKPEVVRITSIGAGDACRRTSNVIYERGVTPSPQGAPMVEMIGGLSGLRLIGPLMHRLDRVEMVIGTGRPQVVRIFDPIGPGGNCDRIYGAGNGGISVELPLPAFNQVTQPLRGKLRLFGVEESALASPLQLQCFDAKKRPIACPATAPATAKLMQEVELRILPRPVLVRTSPLGFSQQSQQVGGRVTFTGENLQFGGFMETRARLSTQRFLSATATTQVRELFANVPQAGTTVTPEFTTTVSLMRGARVQEMRFWDTALEQPTGPIMFPTVEMRFTHARPSTGGGNTGGPITVGGERPPNLQPVRLFAERPLIRRIAGIGDNVQVSPGFCTGLGNNQAGSAQVPSLVWGVSSAQEPSPSVRVELRDGSNNTVLASFDSGPLNANDAGVTRENYPGRPTSLRVIRVTGGDAMREYGNQTGCFLDKAAPAPRMDPAAFVLAVDTQGVVDEGPGEADNELRF